MLKQGIYCICMLDIETKVEMVKEMVKMHIIPWLTILQKENLMALVVFY